MLVWLLCVRARGWGLLPACLAAGLGEKAVLVHRGTSLCTSDLALGALSHSGCTWGLVFLAVVWLPEPVQVRTLEALAEGEVSAIR